MSIIVPETGSIELGRSSITPRETFPGFKDPGNKGEGLRQLARALGELGETVGGLEAKRKAEAEEQALDTAYWDATVDDTPAGASGATGPGATVGERKPTLFDGNNYNSPMFPKVERQKRKHRGMFETEGWLGESGWFSQVPANIIEDPRATESHIEQGRREIIERHKSDPVAGDAALRRYDQEADKWRNGAAAEREKLFKEGEERSFDSELDGSLDSGLDVDDPAEVTPLDEEIPAGKRAALPKGRPVVPELGQAINQVAGNTWMAAYMTRAAQIESSGGRNLANPRSTARGAFQFIKSTAKAYGLNNPMDHFQSAQAMAKFTLDNRKKLVKALGREPTFGELYLAHQQGTGGAIKLLTNPNARAVAIVGSAAVKLNGGKAGMSAQQFANLWMRKFGGGKAAGGGPVQVAANTEEASYTALPDQRANPKTALGIQEPDTSGLLGGTENLLTESEESYLGDKEYKADKPYEYEVAAADDDKVVNDAGEEVLDVPDDPDVIRQRNRYIEVDRKYDTDSVLTRPERRDRVFNHAVNKAIETNDPKWLDAVPKTWMTPEQRAKVVAMKEKFQVDKHQDWVRKNQIEEEQTQDWRTGQIDKATKIITEGGDFDPKKEAMRPDGSIDSALYEKLRAVKDQPKVDAATSTKSKLDMTNKITNAAITGDYSELGFDRPPTDAQLAERILTDPSMNTTEKSELIEKVGTLRQAGGIIGSKDVQDYYEMTFGDAVRAMIPQTANVLGNKDPMLAQKLGSVEKKFKMEVRKNVIRFVSKNGRAPDPGELIDIMEASEVSTQTYLEKVVNDVQTQSGVPQLNQKTQAQQAQPAKPAAKTPNRSVILETGPDGIRRPVRQHETGETF